MVIKYLLSLAGGGAELFWEGYLKNAIFVIFNINAISNKNAILRRRYETKTGHILKFYRHFNQSNSVKCHSLSDDSTQC